MVVIEKIKKVEDLEVFKLSHSLVLDIYKVTENFPHEERFGLIQQIRRSAYSIPMNLIEGSNRLKKREYRRFAGIAKASAAKIGNSPLTGLDAHITPGQEFHFDYGIEYAVGKDWRLPE